MVTIPKCKAYELSTIELTSCVSHTYKSFVSDYLFYSLKLTTLQFFNKEQNILHFELLKLFTKITYSNSITIFFSKNNPNKPGIFSCFILIVCIRFELQHGFYYLVTNMFIQEINILRDEYISTCKILLSICIIASVLVVKWYIYWVPRITNSIVSILQLYIFGFDPKPTYSGLTNTSFFKRLPKRQL